MQIGVITNPNGRKNKGKPDRAARLQSIVGAMGEVHETRTLESIKPVLREFLRKRARYWVDEPKGADAPSGPATRTWRHPLLGWRVPVATGGGRVTPSRATITNPKLAALSTNTHDAPTWA